MSSTTYNPATARTYYLNGTGTRAVSIDHQGNRERILVSLDRRTIRPRAVLYWEQCGNFAFPVIRVGGKAVPLFPSDSWAPRPVWMPYAIKYPGKV